MKGGGPFFTAGRPFFKEGMEGEKENEEEKEEDTHSSRPAALSSRPAAHCSWSVGRFGRHQVEGDHSGVYSSRPVAHVFMVLMWVRPVSCFFSFLTLWANYSYSGHPINLATGDMIVLGKTVILNPQGRIGGSIPKTYNVSIPSMVFGYCDGVSAGSDRSWTCSFTADLGSCDFTPSELVVDCSGDGILTVSPTNFYSAVCDNDGDGTSYFGELYDSLASGGSTRLNGFP